MTRPLAAVAAMGLLALALAAPSWAQRQSFEIATGSTAGTYFPMGEWIAGIVSHPQGLARCDLRGVCGPAGLVVSARTSDGAVANIKAVNAGLTDSGLAQSNVVADAVAGRGIFRRLGKQSHVRVIADLFPEEVQLVATAPSHVTTVRDLRGKRVSLGNVGSGADVIAGEVLAAYGVPLRSLVVERDSYDASIGLLQSGKIDAFFFLGGTPSPPIQDLLARGTVHLVPIAGKERRRLLLRVPSLAADTIPAGTYRGTGAVDTVSCRTLWIVRDSAAPDVVYGLLRALYNPANRSLLASGPSVARYVRLDDAPSGLTAPLHPGAERFYRDAGKLPATR
jgi:uncharacterized protein